MARSKGSTSKKAVERETGETTGTSVSGPRSFTILHLSDLHFGNKSRFQGMDLSTFGDHFAQAVEIARNELAAARPAETGWQRSVDLLIVSGDLAEVAKPSEFESARVFLKALINGLGVPVYRAIFISGNHDLSWTQCKRVDLDLEDGNITKDEHEKALHATKFKHYHKFLDDFYGMEEAELNRLLGRSSLYSSTGAYLYDIDLGGCPVSIAALNTSEKETHTHHGGELSFEQADQLIKAWMQPEYARRIKIALVHHNPLATPVANLHWSQDWFKKQIQDHDLTVDADWLEHYTADMVGFRGQEHLRNIVKDASAHLVLHGHHHSLTEPGLWRRAEKGVAPVLSVGSFSLNADQIPTDQPLTCQLILFQIEPEPKLVAFPLEFEPNFRLPGTLQLGQYKLNLRSEAAYDDSLPLPKGWETTTEKTEEPEVDPAIVSFVAYYRKRVSGLHSSYDLKNLGVLPGEMKKANDPQLDDLYLPLRFDKGFDIHKTDKGKFLDIDYLLELLTIELNQNQFTTTLLKQFTAKPSQKRKGKSSARSNVGAIKQTSDTSVLPVRGASLAITGAAGSGKTTWMRYTFRRMREDPRVLPFLIELRAVALFWQESPPEKQSIEAYLEAWIKKHAPEFMLFGIPLNAILTAPQDWFPVLLIDGWDELGDLGTPFRDQLLGLMDLYPRLLIITSSRPYGTARPSHSDRFTQLQVQPLSSIEISEFAVRFYERCYREEHDLAAKQASEFQVALERSEDAELLAKTPLLLTMMLYINRSMRLPDKRHQLYEACLMSLLSERPALQTAEGARLQLGEWCPSDSGPERMQIVAKMAYRLQTEHGEMKTRRGNEGVTPIVIHKTQLKTYLPDIWTVAQKEGFIQWLCGRAGVMVDDAHDNVNFAHLSFQEFLTAWHLNNNEVGKEAEKQFEKMATSSFWWETLLLWTALLNDNSKSRAEALLDYLSEKGHLILLGMMLADGIGTEQQMTAWARSLGEQLTKVGWPGEEMDRLLRAWQASRQKERRNNLGRILRAIGQEAHWRAVLTINEVLCGIGQPIVEYFDLMRPKCVTQAPILILNNTTQVFDSGRDFAAIRALTGYTYLWPAYPMSLLNLWPSKRRWVSLAIQRCVSIGRDLRGNISKIFGEWYGHALARACDLVRDLGLDRDRNRAFSLARDLARIRDRDLYVGRAFSIVRELVLILAPDLFPSLDVNYNFVSYSASDVTRDFAHNLELDRDLAHNLVANRARNLARERDRDFGHDHRRIRAINHAMTLAFAGDIDIDRARNLARVLNGALDGDIDRYIDLDFARDIDRDLAHGLARDLGHATTLARAHALDDDNARNLTRTLDRARARARALDHDLNVVRDLNRNRNLSLVLERDRDQRRARQSPDDWALFISGPIIDRLALATLHVSEWKFEVWPFILLANAIRSSFLNTSDAKEGFVSIVDMATKSDCDPLWIMLARHFVNESTVEDRELLIDLAAHPEKREGPLSWSLQYIVRGDILLPDDSVITLDQICDECGLDRLPLLEPMSEHLP